MGVRQGAPTIEPCRGFGPASAQRGGTPEDRDVKRAAYLRQSKRSLDAPRGPEPFWGLARGPPSPRALELRRPSAPVAVPRLNPGPHLLLRLATRDLRGGLARRPDSCRRGGGRAVRVSRGGGPRGKGAVGRGAWARVSRLGGRLARRSIGGASGSGTQRPRAGGRFRTGPGTSTAARATAITTRPTSASSAAPGASSDHPRATRRERQRGCARRRPCAPTARGGAPTGRSRPTPPPTTTTRAGGGRTSTTRYGPPRPGTPAARRRRSPATHSRPGPPLPAGRGRHSRLEARRPRSRRGRRRCLRSATRLPGPRRQPAGQAPRFCGASAREGDPVTSISGVPHGPATIMTEARLRQGVENFGHLTCLP